MQRSKSWNAVARALLLAAVLLLGSQLCGGADVEGGAEMRPAMVILLPEAAHTAETFSKFLRRAGDSTEWTAAIRQVFHLTLPDAIGATNCTKPGKSVVFLLEVSAGGEFEALREKARLEGDADEAMRRRKKRKTKAADLHNPCVLWLDEQVDLEAAAGVGLDVLTAATRALPAPYRNTVRRYGDEDEEGEGAKEVGPTGREIPASWRRSQRANKKSAPPANLGSFLILEAGVSAYARGNYMDAVRFLEKAAELRPDDPSPLNKLGQALLARGGGGGVDKDEAVRVFKKVVDAFPRDISARMSLGAILEEEDTQKAREEALSHYVAALDASPRSAEQVGRAAGAESSRPHPPAPSRGLSLLSFLTYIPALGTVPYPY